MERERLSEYVRVLSKRLAAAEEKSSEAEFGLRDERRKTAKLERMLEQGGGRDSFRSHSSRSRSVFLLDLNLDPESPTGLKYDSGSGAIIIRPLQSIANEWR